MQSRKLLYTLIFLLIVIGLITLPLGMARGLVAPLEVVEQGDGINAQWNGARERWEVRHAGDRVGAVSFISTSIDDRKYGLTKLHDAVGAQTILWKPSNML